MQMNRDSQRQFIAAKAMDDVKNGTFENLSIRQFCAEAGITTGAFYRCFPSKEALFRHCYAILLEETIGAADVLLHGLPLEEQLVRFVLLLLQLSAKTGERRVISNTDLPETKAAFRKCHELIAAKLLDILRDAAQEGRFPPDDILTALDAFFIIFRGIYFTSGTFNTVWAPAYEEAVLRRLIRGLLPPQPVS